MVARRESTLETLSGFIYISTGLSKTHEGNGPWVFNFRFLDSAPWRKHQFYCKIRSLTAEWNSATPNSDRSVSISVGPSLHLPSIGASNYSASRIALNDATDIIFILTEGWFLIILHPSIVEGPPLKVIC